MSTSQWFRYVLIAACGVFAPAALPATEVAPSELATSAAIAPERLQAAQAKLARMQQIADRFGAESAALGYVDNAWRFELVNHLMRADSATITRVEGASDLRSALQLAATPPAGAQAKSLGEASNDLVYVPITPCRIVDTRNSGAGGNFGASEARTYTYAGGAAQGGATCTFTAGATPAALAVNVTVVSVGLGNNAAAYGFLSVYPEGGTPGSSWMNYLGSDIKANAGVAAIKQSSGKFSVFAQNPTHVIVDLFGVFRAATDGTPNFVAKWDGTGALGTSSIWDGGAGRIGVGTTTPGYSLDFVGNFPQVHLQETNGRTATLSRYTDRFEITASDEFQVSVGAGGSPDLFVGANHDVGIGTGAPVNRLQVGSVGGSGYSGNDIAFGNGTQASGITQTANYVHWYSTTSIALMPGNGSGRVGINTTSPRVPLEVDGYVAFGPETYGYFNIDKTSTCGGCTADLSILATQNVLALEFDAASDARIKDIVGISDGGRDLETLNAIEVTDYTLKDKVVKGNRLFKKVIAQQVEGVYPQAVNRHPDFIPNVYRTADEVQKTAGGYVLRFDAAHGLSAAARQLRLLAQGDTGMRKVAVLAMPSDREVVVDTQDLDGRRVFVYGEEVDDFRTVDYEALTTLNISATQELVRRMQQQQSDAATAAAAKDAQIAVLRAELAKQSTRIDALQRLTDDVAALQRAAAAAGQHNAESAQAKP